MPFDGVLVDFGSFTCNRIRAKNTVLVLEEALRLIERGWCRHSMGKIWIIPTTSTFRFATRFCSEGAITRASYNLNFADEGIHHDARAALYKAIGKCTVMTWNDKQPWLTGQANVIAAFQKAIVLAEERYKAFDLYEDQVYLSFQPA